MDALYRTNGIMLMWIDGIKRILLEEAQAVVEDVINSFSVLIYLTILLDSRAKRRRASKCAVTESLLRQRREKTNLEEESTAVKE